MMESSIQATLEYRKTGFNSAGIGLTFGVFTNTVLDLFMAGKLFTILIIDRSFISHEPSIFGDLITQDRGYCFVGYGDHMSGTIPEYSQMCHRKRVDSEDEGACPVVPYGFEKNAGPVMAYKEKMSEGSTTSQRKTFTPPE